MDGLKTWDLILGYMFSQKLDLTTRKPFDYEMSTNPRPNLKLFFAFLEKCCIIFERSTIPDLNDSKNKVQHKVHFVQNKSSNKE